MTTHTCHLSSIEITKGDKVVILPVKYHHLTETSSLINGSNHSCTLASLPLFGAYNNAGGVNLDSNSELICTEFRAQINQFLMNNKANRDKRDQARFYFGDSFYVFKRKNQNEAQGCEFSSDTSLIKLSEEESRYLSIDEITKNSELLSYIKRGSLVEMDTQTVHRFGLIMIREDIYSAMINEVYLERSDRVLRNIHSLLETKIEDEFDTFSIGQDQLAAETLELFNTDRYLVNKTLSSVKKSAYNKEKPEHLINGLLNWSLISQMYSDLGKSFYPNVRRQSSMKPIYALSGIVKDHIDNRREINLDYWSPQRGYDSDTQAQEEWNDWQSISD